MKKQYSQETDKELVRRTIDVQEDFFSVLMERYHSQLMTFISSFTPIKQDAEDIVLESFRKAFVSLRGYDPKYEFSTWLYKIASNTAIDHLRKSSGRQTTNLEEQQYPENFNDSIDSISSPEDKMIGSQTYDKIIALINNLEPKYRDVAKLRFLEQYAYQEIADQLVIDINTVRTRIRRAKKILEQQIRETL